MNERANIVPENSLYFIHLCVYATYGFFVLYIACNAMNNSFPFNLRNVILISLIMHEP